MTLPVEPTPAPLVEPSIPVQVKQAEANLETEAVKKAPFLPQWLADDVANKRFTKKNLRAVALSALKAFVVAASAVAVAKSNTLAGSHLTLTDVESVLFSVGVAGGGAALKVLELWLQD